MFCLFVNVILLISFGENETWTLKGLSEANCCHSVSVLIFWALFQQIIIWKIMTLVLFFPAVLTSGNSCHCYTCKLYAWQNLWWGLKMHFCFVDFFSCMANLCSVLKQEQYSMVWLTITTPRRHQRDSIALTVITLDFPFLLVEWIICEKKFFFLINLFYLLKKNKKPSRTNVGDWSPRSIVRYKLTRLEISAIFVDVVPHQKFTFSHQVPLCPVPNLETAGVD